MAPTLRAVRLLGLERAHARVLTEVEHALVDDSVPRALRLVVAAAASSADARAHALFEGAHAKVVPRAGASFDHNSADLVRTIAHAATYGAVPFALAQLDRLAAWFTHVTDRFGTNSHYCRTVLHVVDSLVLAIVDLAVATTTARDRHRSTRLPTTFALT